jgi:hypothetical protein
MFHLSESRRCVEDGVIRPLRRWFSSQTGPNRDQV